MRSLEQLFAQAACADLFLRDKVPARAGHTLSPCCARAGEGAGGRVQARRLRTGATRHPAPARRAGGPADWQAACLVGVFGPAPGRQTDSPSSQVLALAGQPGAADAAQRPAAPDGPVGPGGEGKREDQAGRGRVEWGGLKEVDRVLEKLVRSYKRDPARVLDYCRQARGQRCRACSCSTALTAACSCC
jgi:hypothetical protein